MKLCDIRHTRPAAHPSLYMDTHRRGIKIWPRTRRPVALFFIDFWYMHFSTSICRPIHGRTSVLLVLIFNYTMLAQALFQEQSQWIFISYILIPVIVSMFPMLSRCRLLLCNYQVELSRICWTNHSFFMSCDQWHLFTCFLLSRYSNEM